MAAEQLGHLGNYDNWDEVTSGLGDAVPIAEVFGMPEAHDNRPLYLDYNATTPMAPEVLEAMMPFLTYEFGNAHSRHHVYGTVVHDAVEKARGQVASLINCTPEEIIFTSGATESNNLALIGVMKANERKGKHLITVATEHKAVLEPAEYLREEGFDVTVLPVQRSGLIRLDDLKNAIRPDTILVSVMIANNEIGVLQPVDEIGDVCREAGIYFHSDGAQAVGKIPVDVQKSKIDLLSISGHKFNGPKGIGALFVRRRKPRVKIKPLIRGGGHERGLRSGTLNSPGIVGLGAACRLASETMHEKAEKKRALRNQLWELLQEKIPGVELNGCLEPRLPGNLNIRIPGVSAEALIYRLEGLAVSSGAACSTLEVVPSHVLVGLGLAGGPVDQSLRFSLPEESCLFQLDEIVGSLLNASASVTDLMRHPT